MKNIISTIAVFGFLGFVYGQDTPCTATPLSVNAVCSTTSASNAGMSDSGEGNPGCASYNGGDVWFSFTVPAGGDVTITGFETGGINDGGMALYSGPNCSSLSQEDCDDDGGASLHSEISITGQTPGATMWVRYWEYGGGSSGGFDICVVDDNPAPPPAPANDDPCSATALPIGAATCTFQTESSAGATASAGVPAPGCASYSTGDVWFSIVVPASGNIDIDTDIGTITDGGMAMYSGACGALTLIECDDDDSPNGAMSYISLTGQTPGNTLYIRVWDFSDGTGTFDICASEPSPPPPGPVNDDPCGAIALPVGVNTCTFQTETSVSATASAGVPAPGCASYSTGDVWFSVVVPASGNIDIDTDTGTITDAGMAMYSGACGSLTLIECDDDDSPNGAMSFISLTGQTPGNTLYIRFWDYSDGTGTFDICASEPPPPPPVGPCGNAMNNDFCSNPAILTQGGSSWTSNTSSSYTADNDAGVETPFCGSIENNSWYQFTALSTTETFNFTNISSCTDGDGVQAEVFDITTNGLGCCTANSSVSNCYNPGTPSNGTVSATGLTIGNTYYLMVDGWGGDQCDFTVTGWTATGILTPVELVSFDGITYPDYNLLKWTTASERNNDYFILEKSTDGINFESFGKEVKGQGTVVKYTDYTGVDENPLPGTTYYRFKQFDFDGEFTYSDIIALNRDVANIGALRTYPNPFEDNVKFQFNLSKAQEVEVSFTNQLGKVVYSELFQCLKGSNKIDLNTIFNSGLYIVKVKSNNGELNQSRKMIKN